jgi:serine/threonine protein kinase
MSLEPGSRLGPYEIVAVLGAGGMGEVYRARDPRIGREVAVKILPPEFAASEDRRRRFEQEARGRGAQPSEPADDLRRRQPGRSALHRHRTAGGRDAP